jgi:hypothetical protein
MTGADRQAALLALLRQFARADRRREFAFSSGVVGAVPMDDTAALACAQRGATLSLLALCVREKAQFVIAALLPARNVALLVRTLLRKALNDAPEALHSGSVISVGAQPADADPYFGAFLAASDEPINYLKIVGGFALRAKGWRFIETSLSYPALFGLALQGLLHPLLVLARLAAGAATIEGWRAKLLFIALACRETHRGTAFQGLLTARALGAHVNSEAVRMVIFPMEGRNWEKRLLACINARGARSTGYLHCALTPRHAGLLHPGFFTDAELPTVLRTPGPMAAKAITPAFPAVEVKSGYFIRGDWPQRTALPPQGEALMFALTGNIGESRRLLQAIARLPAGDGRPVVRLNPHAASHGRLRHYAQELGLDIWVAGAAAPRLCFFRSSSVAIGYLRMGVVPIYLDLGEVFSNNSFDVETDRRFERVTLDDGFAAAVSALARKYRSASVADGPALADYYLDQSYQGKVLAGLNELS